MPCSLPARLSTLVITGKPSSGAASSVTITSSAWLCSVAASGVEDVSVVLVGDLGTSVMFTLSVSLQDSILNRFIGGFPSVLAERPSDD